MNKNATWKPRIWMSLAAVLVAGALVAAYAMQPSAVAQDSRAKQQADGKDKAGMSMNCPMMAGLKGIKLHPDSPQLLAARTDELKLTEAQHRELELIAQAAREKSRDVLTAEQREQLGKPTEEPMSVMEIAKMRMKGKMTDDKGQMCPMCMKMMRTKMKDKSSAPETETER